MARITTKRPSAVLKTPFVIIVTRKDIWQKSTEHQDRQTDTGAAKKKSHQHRGATNWVDTGQPEKDSDTDSELPLFKIKDSSKAVHPITVDMKINGRVLNMEVDTGAAVSIISKATYQKLFSEVPVKPASLHLRTYTGETISIEGEMITQVKYGSQTKELGLIMVSKFIWM